MDETRQRQETGGEDAEERDSRQQQAAFAAAVIRHGRIACIGCLIH